MNDFDYFEKKLNRFFNVNIVIYTIMIMICLAIVITIGITYNTLEDVKTDCEAVKNSIEQYYIDADNQKGCVKDTTNVFDVKKIE